MTGSEANGDPSLSNSRVRAMFSAAGQGRVAVYDMDGVITYADTFGHLARRNIRRMRLRNFCRFTESLRADYASERSYPLKVMLIRASVVAVLDGLDETSYAREVTACVESLGGLRRWVRHEVVDEMRASRQQGIKIIIATACERRLAEAMLRSENVEFDELSASLIDLDSTTRKWHIEDYRIGSRKAQALEESGTNLANVTFVTDSRMDIATARRCRSTEVVCPADGRLVEWYVQQGIAAKRWGSRLSR